MSGSVWSAVFRDDDIVVVGDSGRQVTLIDTARLPSAGPVGAFTTHYGTVVELAVLRPAPARLVLVTVGLNSPVIDLWDITDPARVEPLGPTCGGGTLTKEDDGYYCRDGSRILDLATDRNGRFLAAADGAGTARVWDISEDKLHQVATLEAIVHIGDEAEAGLAFAGDNHTLISTSPGCPRRRRRTARSSSPRRHCRPRRRPSVVQCGGRRVVGVSRSTVGKWRSRFIERRLDGLADEGRPGAGSSPTGRRRSS